MLSAQAPSGETSHLWDHPESAYIHIPFCRRRCYYCDFPIAVVGDKPPLPRTGSREYGTISHYVKILCQEISLTAPAGVPLSTIFFGGGTPSLLTVEQLRQILTTLNQQFGVLETAEISMEVDPGTFDLEQLQGYRDAGVNRFSLGVQAFQANLLQTCGRSHSVADIYRAVDLMQQAGVKNFSLDLISGLPHQTLDDWQESLARAIALEPTHLSCYDLTIEAGTPFSRQYQPGARPLPSDETTAMMYRTAQRLLTAAGYDHYEISNYAKPGYQCQHNRVYWKNRSFYGFGMGATSYLQGDRVSRPRKTREYYDWVAAMPPGDATIASSAIDPGVVWLDTLMVGLRLAEGLPLAELADRFGQARVDRLWRCLQPYYKQGWVALSSDVVAPEGLPTSGTIRLTDPEGFLFSNVILVALFEEFDREGAS